MAERSLGGDRARRVVAAVLGLLLIAAGVLLFPRPLTSLLILLILLAVAPALCASFVALKGWRGVRLPRATLLVVGGASIVATVGLLLFLPEFARVLPWGLALAAFVLGAIPPVRVMRAQISGGSARVVAVLWAITGTAVAVICWMWPDLAVIAAGYLTAIGAMGLGLVVIVRGLHRAGVVRDRPAKRTDPAKRTRSAKRAPAQKIARVVGAATAAILSVALVAGSAVVWSASPRVDDFYTYAGDIPTTPGALLKTEPYRGDVPTGATAVRILYSSTYGDGSPALASAVIAYPSGEAPDDSRRVLAWQHGTTGIAQSCAPSISNIALTGEAIPGIERAIEKDWVVVATDYPGQGTPGRYPYLIGEGEGRSTLDAVRAARQLTEAKASDDVLLWGHSQGGHATLWAAQIADTYAPELHIRGVAALSAASDPLFEARTVVSAGAVASVVVPYLLVPYADEYDDVDAAEIVHPAGTAIVDAMASRCATDTTMLASVLSAAAVSQDVPLFNLDLESGVVADRLRQNVASGLVPAPLFLGQGIDDEVIPIEMQRALESSLSDAGRDVEVHEYEERSHMGVVAPDSPLIDDLYSWEGQLSER